MTLTEGQVLIGKWILVTQENINDFARVTGDYQEIHLNEEAAKKAGFKTTLAHGMLTFSLVVPEVVRLLNPYIDGSLINCGSDKLRYTEPVLRGLKIRPIFTVDKIKSSKRGALIKMSVSVEIEGISRPAMTAEITVMNVNK